MSVANEETKKLDLKKKSKNRPYAVHEGKHCQTSARQWDNDGSQHKDIWVCICMTIVWKIHQMYLVEYPCKRDVKTHANDRWKSCGFKNLFQRKARKNYCRTKTFVLSSALVLAYMRFDGEAVAAARQAINLNVWAGNFIWWLPNKRDTITMINCVLGSMPGSVDELCVGKLSL